MDQRGGHYRNVSLIGDVEESRNSVTKAHYSGSVPNLKRGPRRGAANVLASQCPWCSTDVEVRLKAIVPTCEVNKATLEELGTFSQKWQVVCFSRDRGF